MRTPSPEDVELAGHAAGSTPEPASDQFQVTVTSALFQPPTLGAGEALGAAAGAVRSMLIPVTVVDALLPALSTTVPVTDWPAPSFARVTGPVHDATPDALSAQLKETVTSALFQPLAFAAGAREPTIVGAMVSRTVTGNSAVPLVAAVAVQTTAVVPSGNVPPEAGEHDTGRLFPEPSNAVGAV